VSATGTCSGRMPAITNRGTADRLEGWWVSKLRDVVLPPR
jgi:hypothetical protein